MDAGDGPPPKPKRRFVGRLSVRTASSAVAPADAPHDAAERTGERDALLNGPPPTLLPPGVVGEIPPKRPPRPARGKRPALPPLSKGRMGMYKPSAPQVSQTAAPQPQPSPTPQPQPQPEPEPQPQPELLLPEPELMPDAVLLLEPEPVSDLEPEPEPQVRRSVSFAADEAADGPGLKPLAAAEPSVAEPEAEPEPEPEPELEPEAGPEPEPEPEPEAEPDSDSDEETEPITVAAVVHATIKFLIIGVDYTTAFVLAFCWWLRTSVFSLGYGLIFSYLVVLKPTRYDESLSAWRVPRGWMAASVNAAIALLLHFIFGLIDLFDGFGLAEERTSAGDFFVDIGMLPPLETSRMRFILPDLLIVSVGGCTFFVRRMRKRKQKREKENEAARRQAEGGASRRGMQAMRNSSRAMASMASGACLFSTFPTPNLLHHF